MDKTKTTVRIAGKNYTLTSYDSEEHVRRIAAYVDRMIGELNHATRMPVEDLAVLTALRLADESIKAHDEITKLKAEAIEREQEK